MNNVADTLPAYCPLWEPLGSALARVMLTGIPENEAKLQIVTAIAERTIAVRVEISSPAKAGKVRWLEHKHVRPPTDLGIDDFDWSRSAPASKWQAALAPTTRSFHHPAQWAEQTISRLEVSTNDVTRIWCDSAERAAREAEFDALPAPELPDWFTPMQAVAWIVSRDPRIVHYAAPDYTSIRTDFVAPKMPDGSHTGQRIGSPLKMSMRWLDDTLSKSDSAANISTDGALSALLKSLRNGTLVANARWKATGERRDMAAVEWADLTFGTPPKQDSLLLPCCSVPEKRAKVIDTRWSDVRISRNGCVSLWPATTVAIWVPGGGWELRDLMADQSERDCEAELDDAEEDRIAGMIESFRQEQIKTRQWISFADIADWCARKEGSIRRIERDYIHTLWLLHYSADRGEFELEGRMRVAFLHEALYRPELSREEYCGLPIEIHERSETITPTTQMYLESCWVPCDLCRDWLEAKQQEMPPWLPARTEVMPPLRQSAEDGDDPEPAAPRNATLTP